MAYDRPPYDTRRQDPPGEEREMTPRVDHGEASYVGNGLLEGRKALITGGDSGIGRAIAIAFAREGADIVIAYLSEHDDARETARWVQKAGRRAVLIAGDLGDRRFCRQTARDAVRELEGIDILVNNAAYQRTYESIESIPDDEFEEAFRVNVFAPFYLSKELLRQMPEGASIINTASIQSFDPGAQLMAYAATKAALASLTHSMAELAMERGVRVNAVAPGPVWTPLIPATINNEEKVRCFGSNTLLGRAAQPAELAPLYVFLASDRASYVAGEIYGVTGGRMQM